MPNWIDETDPLNPTSSPPSSRTALDAANLQALEDRALQRAQAYTDQAVAGIQGGSGDTHTVADAVNASGAITVAMVGGVVKWINLTLTGDVTITMVPVKGAKVILFITEDAVGGHTVSLSDGATPTPTVELIDFGPTVAGESGMVQVYSPDGVKLWPVSS